MNNILDSETLEAIASPLISCPNCFSGSSELADLARKQSIWSNIECKNCGESFEISEAIDEHFANNLQNGYALWAGAHNIAKQVICESGKATLVDVKGVFEEIYSINHSFSGSATYLADGISTHYIPQGFIMISVAPNNNGHVDSLHLILNIEGRTHTQPKLIPWQQMLLQAKLNLFSAPNLSVIMSLNAVDLFIEQMSIMNIRTEKSRGRPDLWSYFINDILNVNLRKILGKKDFLLVEKFVQTRNAIAHGDNYLEKLPENIRKKEEKWLLNNKHKGGTANFSPCANFALRMSLMIIRKCRRLIDKH